MNSLSVVPSRTRAQLRRDRNASSVAPGDDSPDRFQQQRRRPLRGRRGGRDHLGEGQAGLPDGYSQIFRWYVFGPSGFWTMAPLRYAAKFDPFLSLDCAPTPSTLVQSKERKGSNFAIWQPWAREGAMMVWVDLWGFVVGFKCLVGPHTDRFFASAASQK